MGRVGVPGQRLARQGYVAHDFPADVWRFCGTALVEGERCCALDVYGRDAWGGLCVPDSDLARRLSATVRVEKVAAMFLLTGVTHHMPASFRNQNIIIARI